MGWADIGTLNYLSAGGTNFTAPHQRHLYAFDPVNATGLRLIVPIYTAIDEIEIFTTLALDAPWTNTSQVNVTPFPINNNIVAGINFVNNSVSSPGTSILMGVAFEDVNVHPGTGATYDFTTYTGGGSLSLTANGQGPTLETRFGFLHDRHDNGGAVSGADATVANLILEDIHTICSDRPDDCDEQEMTVSNLTPNTNVYLQFFGGDQGWNGQLSMSVNGAVVGTWTTVTSNYPSTFGFKTMTNSAGELNIDMNIVSGNYAGVCAFFVIDESQANAAPTANAGTDQSIRAGDRVNLDGSASNADNTASAALVYAWTFSLKPLTSNATLVNANTAMPSFEVDVAGTYSLDLVVNDEGALASEPDIETISSNNLAPTAIAGNDQLVIVGAPVSLDGSGSNDPETDDLT